MDRNHSSRLASNHFMPATETIGSFFSENKKLVKDYFDTRLEIYKLKLIRIISKSAGYFVWMVVLSMFIFLFSIFLGLVAGFWLSNLTGSYVLGFGIVTLVIMVKIIMLALLRKKLFVDPVIRNIIRRLNEPENLIE